MSVGAAGQIASLVDRFQHSDPSSVAILGGYLNVVNGIAYSVLGFICLVQSTRYRIEDAAEVVDECASPSVSGPDLADGF